MKFDIIPIKFPHYAHYLPNDAYQNLVLCASCSMRTAVVPVKPPELTVLLLAGSGSLRVRGSPRQRPQTPHPQTNYCHPQRHQWHKPRCGSHV